MSLLQLAGLILAFAPLAAFVLLAVPAFFGRPASERTTVGLVGLTFAAGTLAALAAAFIMLRRGLDEVPIPLGTWFTVGSHTFRWDLMLDRLSLPMAALGVLLVGLTAAFSSRYLHREDGFTRFYLMLLVYAFGVEIVALAGSLDLLILGWELVGISSALLIAFFHYRPKPIRHGLRAFVTYRICDVGLLGALIAVRHPEIVLQGAWAGFVVPAGAIAPVAVGLLLLLAAMGKSAQVPFGGWLPRAMEGPTPSSAIFYGALSIHLGPFLLLRSAPLLDHAPAVAHTVAIVGALTALHATFVGRSQTDIKSALAYASMTQVGLMFLEIGLGFRFLVLLHLVGHACVRTLQFLRSPSLLHDHHHLEQAMGQLLPRTGGHLERLVPATWQPWLYRHALERGYFDSWLKDYVVGGFVRLAQEVDRLDRAWIALLAHVPTSKTGREGAPREVPR